MQEDSKKIIGQRFLHFRRQKGRNIPRPDVMKQLANRLDVPLREILGEQEQTLKVGDQITIIAIYMEMRHYAQAQQLISPLLTHEELLEFQRNHLPTSVTPSQIAYNWGPEPDPTPIKTLT